MAKKVKKTTENEQQWPDSFVKGRKYDGKPLVDPAIPGLHKENEEFIERIHKKVMKELEKEGKAPKKKTKKQKK